MLTSSIAKAFAAELVAAGWIVWFDKQFRAICGDWRDGTLVVQRTWNMRDIERLNLDMETIAQDVTRLAQKEIQEKRKPTAWTTPPNSTPPDVRFSNMDNNKQNDGE
jgi:hypothetical protein